MTLSDTNQSPCAHRDFIRSPRTETVAIPEVVLRCLLETILALRTVRTGNTETYYCSRLRGNSIRKTDFIGDRLYADLLRDFQTKMRSETHQKVSKLNTVIMKFSKITKFLSFITQNS